jgi:hypothetical protein
MLSTQNENTPVQDSMQALLETYARLKGANNIMPKMLEIFNNKHIDFLARVKRLDEIMAEEPAYEPLSEIIFDLLMVQFLAAEPHKETFFDSPEWQHIEDETISRGTELLNLLLYISDANEADAEISLDDFLNEFLLVDTDEFQDEYKIYEELIRNTELMEAELSSVKQIQSAMKEDAELKDIFTPLVLFFQNPYNELPPPAESNLSAYEASVLNCLCGYNRG